jgi:hypothetical protein
MTDDDSNVIPFRRNANDPLITRLEAKLKILTWSSEMLKAGLMPDDVSSAFATYFGDEMPARL